MTFAVHDSRPPTTVAFDRLAASYDVLTGGEIFRLLRQRTQRTFARHFGETSRVLEIGCGTGIDTQFLAARCQHVVACDPSEEMVTRSLRRLATEGLATRATVMLCGLQDLQSYLDALAPNERFDGIVSNFGALNCVRHLAPLGALVRRHLRPGGVVVLGVMTRFCALEATYFTATRRPRLATRRLAKGAVAVPVAGVEVPTYYHRVREIQDALGVGFRLVGIEGVGIIIPPPYLEPHWRALPHALRSAVAACDGMIATWPLLNRIGDHVLLQFADERAHG
jgi:SAM-dependent methyltransferase